MFEAVELGSRVEKGDYEAQLPALRVALINAQHDLRHADFPVLVLLVGDDRIGCVEVLNALNEWMDARYVQVHIFGEPTQEERERPRFWRYWRRLPGDGELALFSGGWVLRALADRLDGEIDDAALDRLTLHAANLEHTLRRDGTLVLKFWLHLPKREHKKRLKEAKSSREGWRIDERDWAIYERYDEALPVAERFLRRTADAAPWHLVESSDRRHRNLTVAKTLLSAIEGRLGGTAPPSPSFAKTAAASSSEPVSVLDRVDLSASIEREEYSKRLAKLQRRLNRRGRTACGSGISTVLVFEGWDAAGKGGVIRRITRAIDVQDHRLHPIAAPSEEERRHHYLWRFWRRLPRAGRVAIFDRSWYGRVLVERVEGYAREDEWQRAYGEITDFEEQLVEHGMVVQKFWLHIDRDEQLRRFREREQTAYKKYKITDEDYRNRERWSDYEAAVDEMVARTSTDIAPWVLVPANDKRWARLQVLEAICETLERALEER